MRLKELTAMILVPLALWSGCGPDCQSTCHTLYDDGQCNIPTPGRDMEDAFSDCVNECEYALSRTGEMGDYNPDKQNTSGTSPVLENEVQAAAWMDCIEETSCEVIDEGYCAPT